MINKDLVYICSPLHAETEAEIHRNIENAKMYVKAVEEKLGCRAVAPHAILPVFLDDNIQEERELGLKFGLDLLKICKGVVICGPIISKGMENEIDLALKLGIPVYDFNMLPNRRVNTICIGIAGE